MNKNLQNIALFTTISLSGASITHGSTAQHPNLEELEDRAEKAASSLATTIKTDAEFVVQEAEAGINQAVAAIEKVPSIVASSLKKAEGEVLQLLSKEGAEFLIASLEWLKNDLEQSPDPFKKASSKGIDCTSDFAKIYLAKYLEN